MFAETSAATHRCSNAEAAAAHTHVGGDFTLLPLGAGPAAPVDERTHRQPREGRKKKTEYEAVICSRLCCENDADMWGDMLSCCISG